MPEETILVADDEIAKILENRLAEIMKQEPGLEEFMLSVAGSKPLLPAGGSVAALAGALAAALGEMVSSLTEGREKFASVDVQVRQIHAKLSRLRDMLRTLVQEDSAAFKCLLDAMTLPKVTEEQKAARAEEIEKATGIATETPLRIARATAEVLEYMRMLVEEGNPNARSDAAVGAQLAYASLKGAQYNVLENIRRMKDKVFAESCREEVTALVNKGEVLLQQVDTLVTQSR